MGLRFTVDSLNQREIQDLEMWSGSSGSKGMPGVRPEELGTSAGVGEGGLSPGW